MNLKIKIRRCVDLLLVCALLLLMPYSLIGETFHEWLGIGMGLLVLLHLFLNRGWIPSLGRGRYSAYRTFQTVIALLCLAVMAGVAASGLLLSNHVFPDLRVRVWEGCAVQLHLGGSFWGFVLMSLHLELHWEIVWNHTRTLPAVSRKILRVSGWLAALYGVFAFWKRDFPKYLLLRTHFLMFEDGDTVPAFLLDYLAIMILFALCSHYIGKRLKRRSKGI